MAEMYRLTTCPYEGIPAFMKAAWAGNTLNDLDGEVMATWIDDEILVSWLNPVAYAKAIAVMEKHKYSDILWLNFDRGVPTPTPEEARFLAATKGVTV